MEVIFLIEKDKLVTIEEHPLIAPTLPIITRSKTRSLSKPRIFLTQTELVAMNEPKFFKKSNGNPLWYKSMEEEYNTFTKNHT